MALVDMPDYIEVPLPRGMSIDGATSVRYKTVDWSGAMFAKAAGHGLRQRLGDTQAAGENMDKLQKSISTTPDWLNTPMGESAPRGDAVAAESVRLIRAALKRAGVKGDSIAAIKGGLAGYRAAWVELVLQPALTKAGATRDDLTVDMAYELNIARVAAQNVEAAKAAPVVDLAGII